MSEEEIERRHPLAECERCPLAKDKSTKYVPSTIVEGAKVAFVGEAPGRNEARKGRPFIGPSGKLLDMVFAKVGIDRKELTLTNSVCCNKPSGNITPTGAAIRACRPRLVAELEGVETVVPMGNAAAEAVLGRSVKITQERIGPSKQGSKIFPDARIIPTIHPAACLRFSDHFPFLLTDIAKVVDPVEKRWKEPDYVIWNDFKTVRDSLPLLAGKVPEGAPIALDIETGVEKDDVFTHPSELLCIGLSWADDKAVVIEREALRKSVVRDMLISFLSKRKLIGHNLKFDLQVLNNLWDLWDTKDELVPYFDTMLASYALDERRGTNSLDFCGQEILGTPNWKGVIKKYINPKKESYANVPVDVLDKYNAYDVAVTWSLYEVFSIALERRNLRHVHDMMIGFSEALAYVEKDGIKVDLEFNQELFEKYSEILEPLEDKLRPWVDNPRSYVQVRQAIAPYLGVEIDDAKEKLESDEEAINGYLELAMGKRMDDLARFCRLLLEYRREYKQFSTYVKGLRKRCTGDRTYPTYLIHGTTSGRLSSRNPNIQNQTREGPIRNQYIPDAGRIFIQGDYAGAENRVVAVESGDKYLMANIDDWNKMVATQLYGEGYTSEQYVRGKAMVHGFNYLRGAYSLAIEYDMTEFEAQKYLDEYKAMIPGVVAWQEDVKKKILSGGPLETAFGRRRRFHLITKDNKMDMLKEGMSFIPQSTVSDINNIALARLVELAKTEYKGVLFVRVPVHDSILTEWREDMMREGAVVVKQVMEETALLYTDVLPFSVDIEVGHNWGEKRELDLAP